MTGETIHVRAESANEAIMVLRQQGIESWEIEDTDDTTNVVAVTMLVDEWSTTFEKLVTDYPHRFTHWEAA